MEKNYTLLFILFVVGYVNAQDLTTGLIAHYTFDNGTYLDQTSNGNDAVNHGTTPTWDIHFIEDQAISFGSESHISLPEDILLKEELSISLWFKTSFAGVILGTQNQEALDNNGVSSSWVPIIYIDEVDKYLRAGFWTGTANQKIVSTTNFTDNKWHHLVLIADDSKEYLYVDNQKVGEELYDRTILSTLKYAQLGAGKVAAWQGSNNKTWDDFDGGKMEDVKIYDQAITSDIVEEIYNLEKPENTVVPSNLVAYYTFENGSMLDRSHNNNHATNNGSIGTEDINSTTDMAVSFGEDDYISLPNSILLQAELSISLWFKATERCGILGYQAGSALGGATTYVPIIYIDDDKILKTAFWSNAKRSVNNMTTDYTDGEWHHLVLTAKGANQSLYIDNQFITGTTYGHSVLSSMVNAQLGVAKTEDWSTVNGVSWLDFNGGSLDNVRIYHDALNVADVNLIFQEEKAQNTTGLLANTGLEKLDLYPNPATSVINTEEGQLEIFDILGNQVLSTESAGKADVSNLAHGIYFVTQNGKRAKLIIE